MTLFINSAHFLCQFDNCVNFFVNVDNLLTLPSSFHCRRPRTRWRMLVESRVPYLTERISCWALSPASLSHKLWIWPLRGTVLIRHSDDLSPASLSHKLWLWPLRGTVLIRHSNDLSYFSWLSLLYLVINKRRHYLFWSFCSESTSISLYCWTLPCEENMADACTIRGFRADLIFLTLRLAVACRLTGGPEPSISVYLSEPLGLCVYLSKTLGLFICQTIGSFSYLSRTLALFAYLPRPLGLSIYLPRPLGLSVYSPRNLYLSVYLSRTLGLFVYLPRPSDFLFICQEHCTFCLFAKKFCCCFSVYLPRALGLSVCLPRTLGFVVVFVVVVVCFLLFVFDIVACVDEEEEWLR